MGVTLVNTVLALKEYKISKPSLWCGSSHFWILHAEEHFQSLRFRIIYCHFTMHIFFATVGLEPGPSGWQPAIKTIGPCHPPPTLGIVIKLKMLIYYKKNLNVVASMVPISIIITLSTKGVCAQPAFGAAHRLNIPCHNSLFVRANNYLPCQDLITEPPL